MELFDLLEDYLIDQDDGFKEAADLVLQSGYAIRGHPAMRSRALRTK